MENLFNCKGVVSKGGIITSSAIRGDIRRLGPLNGVSFKYSFVGQMRRENEKGK